MTKADSVHSTPPLNSSSIQCANPLPEGRGESVDSFSQPPAIGQPGSGNLASESGKPAKGLSRRAALAGLAILPAALPIAAAVPTYAAIAGPPSNAPLLRAEEMVKVLREGSDIELDLDLTERMLSYFRSRDVSADESHLSEAEEDADTNKLYRDVLPFFDRYNQSLDWVVFGDPGVMICRNAVRGPKVHRDKQDDPIFAAIEHHRRAYQEYVDNLGEDEIEDAVPQEKRRSCLRGALHGEPDWQVSGDDPTWIAHIQTACRTSKEEEEAAVALVNSENLTFGGAVALMCYAIEQERQDKNCWKELCDENNKVRSFQFFVMEQAIRAFGREATAIAPNA